jgi:Acyclic terpene utilisation family protein AtuA
VAEPIRIANCSGFFGDRLAAAREMVDGGPIDVLSGDWLAELTMLILAKGMARDPAGGYARTFLIQMEQVMGDCLERGIKVVSNAGGLSPSNCVVALTKVAERLGLNPVIAIVEGDNLLPRLSENGFDFAHMETREPLGDRHVITANAYLGGWGIAEALDQGADIVVTGRVTDAALVVGPAAWRHRWGREDWDRLAGAVVAGHVIECGAQATGGNYAFFKEVPGLEHPGFPIAEVAEDGSSIITKHESHGGLVSVGTVTAQLLYEIGAPQYLNPDVTTFFDTISLGQTGNNRVSITGVKGGPPPVTAKVAMTYRGSYRSTSTLFLTGLDIEAKAALIELSLWDAIPGGREAFENVDMTLIRTDREDPASNEQASAELRITVTDPEEGKVGRAFSSRITELALASYPGIYVAGAMAKPESLGVYWPALVPAHMVRQEIVIGDSRTVVNSTQGAPSRPLVRSTNGAWDPVRSTIGQTRRCALGLIMGARSGDKGGNANVGVWTGSDVAYAWLTNFLTAAELSRLLPETSAFEIKRYELPNLRAMNFVVVGLLGEGVATSTRRDRQAKSLGEWLRARHADIPEMLLT